MGSGRAFEPLRPVGGYLPIEDYGLIGDGETAALVGRDGAIPWMCLPRFDSDPLFCAILGTRTGGAFTIAPEDLVESRQFYEGETGVLVTEMRARSGAVVRLTDAMALRSGADLFEDAAASRRELLRSATVLEGEARLRFLFEPRGGARAERHGAGLQVHSERRPDLELHLSCNLALEGVRQTFHMRAGETACFRLGWAGARNRHRPVPPEEALTSTRRVWERWMAHCRYEGPQKALVRRSAITLKLLAHFHKGAIVAAPTSSLPEVIGGGRNWDYRYAWVRDAALAVYALHRIGYSAEAAGFLGWVLDAVERGGRVKVLYNLEGREPPEERTDPDLQGYRGSCPVRWGNAAAGQRQNDAYGEIIDCAYQWAKQHGRLDGSVWNELVRLIDEAGREWRSLDHGIWEVRTPERPFTYSAAMCAVALERGADLSERFDLPGDPNRWRQCAAGIRQAILEESWDPQANALTEHLGGGALDASLLSLPLRRVLPFDHPRMKATAETIAAGLSAGGGLLYRYLPGQSADGLPGREGAFLLCSFWLVDNLAGVGRIREAMDLYDSLCARAGPLGLLPEQIDPATGAFLGNYPQAFSHTGLISSGVRLARLTTERC